MSTKFKVETVALTVLVMYLMLSDHPAQLVIMAAAGFGLKAMVDKLYAYYKSTSAYEDELKKVINNESGN